MDFLVVIVLGNPCLNPAYTIKGLMYFVLYIMFHCGYKIILLFMRHRGNDAIV